MIIMPKDLQYRLAFAWASKDKEAIIHYNKLWYNQVKKMFDNNKK